MELSKVRTVKDIIAYTKERFDISAQRLQWLSRWLCDIQSRSCVSLDETFYKVSMVCPFNNEELAKFSEVIDY